MGKAEKMNDSNAIRRSAIAAALGMVLLGCLVVFLMTVLRSEASAQPPPPPPPRPSTWPPVPNEKTDIVFLMDGSGSISPQDWEWQQEGYAAALADKIAFPRDGRVAVGLIQWSGTTTNVEIPLTVINSDADAQALIAKIKGFGQRGGGTNPGDGVDAGAAELVGKGRQDARWVECMTTDGTRNSGRFLDVAVPDAMNAGVDRYAVIGIEDPPGALEADLRAHYGPHVFGGGSVSIARNAIELGGLVAGSCINSPVDLVALEVNQSVQTWTNSVTLVEGKSTGVRAFVQTASGQRPQTVYGRLYGSRNGAPLPDSPLTATNEAGRVTTENDVVAKRAQLGASLNFLLPKSWTSGTVRLRLEASGTPLICKEAAGPTKHDCEAEVTFQPQPNASVKFLAVPLNLGNSKIQPTTEELTEQALRMQSLLPVPKLDFETAVLNTSFKSQPLLSTVNAAIGLQKMADGCFPPPNPAACKTLYHGIVLQGSLSLGQGLASSTPGFYSSSFTLDSRKELDVTYGRNIASHQVGHLLGLQDAVDSSLGFSGNEKHGHCGETAKLTAPDHSPFGTISGSNGSKTAPLLGPLGNPDTEVWGLDTRFVDNSKAVQSTVSTRARLAVVDPHETSAVMSFCYVGSPQLFWPSASEYEALFNAVETRFLAAAASTTGNHAVISGVVELSGKPETVEFQPVRVLDGTMPVPADGSYSVRLRRTDGSILTTVPFEPDAGEWFPLPGAAEPPPVGLFHIPIPVSSAYARVEVLKGSNVIGGVNASAHAPQVTLVSPVTGGIESSDQMRFAWNGSDADGDQLTYDVRYSPDGGATWDTVALGVTERSVDVPRRLLKGSTDARFEVIVSDGVLASSTKSGAFTVAPNRPEIFITRPFDDQTVYSGLQTVNLEAVAFDREDADVSNVRWTSSEDGPLPVGSTPAVAANLSIRADTLSEGDHTLAATATDSDGQTATDTVAIRIVRVPPPPSTLLIEKGGTGNGTVSGAGIDCGTDCVQTFLRGAEVILRADPDPDSTFTGWSGACTGRGECSVIMDEARSVRATFTAIPRHSLVVGQTGTGSGTVTSTPPGIDCGNACVHGFNEGTTVRLVATPVSNSYFAGWSGACAGEGSCGVTMTQGETVTARFERDTGPPLGRIRRPRNRHAYKPSSLRALRGTSGDAFTKVTAVHVALRKKLQNGSCRWLRGKTFRRLPCSQKLWNRAIGTVRWRYPLPKLPKSVETKVRGYRVFARASDAAGNIERRFMPGRNSNAFEIRASLGTAGRRVARSAADR